LWEVGAIRIKNEKRAPGQGPEVGGWSANRKLS